MSSSVVPDWRGDKGSVSLEKERKIMSTGQVTGYKHATEPTFIRLRKDYFQYRYDTFNLSHVHEHLRRGLKELKAVESTVATWQRKTADKPDPPVPISASAAGTSGWDPIRSHPIRRNPTDNSPRIAGFGISVLGLMLDT